VLGHAQPVHHGCHLIRRQLLALVHHAAGNVPVSLVTLQETHSICC
jgi:hypothetical protein